MVMKVYFNPVVLYRVPNTVGTQFGHLRSMRDHTQSLNVHVVLLGWSITKNKSEDAIPNATSVKHNTR